MLVPSIFGESLFDDFMDFPFEREFFRRTPSYGKTEKNIMKTDVKETDNAYELDIDLPGYKKDEVTAKLENGYLTISAEKGLDKDEDKEGRYIRRERFSGSGRRTFYVGENVEQSDIKASFKHGILRLTIPKKEEKPEVEENNYISIEG